MTQVQVKIAKLKNYVGDEPMYQHEGDSGFDLRAGISEKIELLPGETKLIPAGIKVAVPIGYELQVRTRSGMALKSECMVLNSPGTVDSGYRGEVGVILHNASKNTWVDINPGDRAAFIFLLINPILFLFFYWSETNRTNNIAIISSVCY